MTALRKHIHILAATAALATAPFAGAWAQEVEQAAERLKTYVTEMGFRMEWDRVDVSGADGVLVGARVESEELSVPIGDITLSGVSEDDVGFRIERVFLSHFGGSDDEEEATFIVENLEMGNVLLPNDDVRYNYGGSLFPETASVGSMILNLGGTEVFSMRDMHFEATEPDADTPMDFSGAAESFTLDLSLMEDEQQLAILKALGYDTMEGFFEIAGVWDPSDGRYALTQYDMTIVDAGTIGLTFDSAGYTPAVIASLYDLLKKMAENPESDNSAQGLAMLGLMQQVTFKDAALSFTDDSLTNRILEFVARNQGAKPAEIANQAKAVVPFALAQLNNPELTAQAAKAVSAFLDDPQSLTIAARPAEPVPLALIGAIAMSAPLELTKMLGLTVTAND